MKREGYIFDRQNEYVMANNVPRNVLSLLLTYDHTLIAFGENVIKESLSRNA